MKKQGDKQKSVPLSLGQMSAKFARELAVPDERFNRFYDYIPLPALAQEDGFWRDKRRTKALIAGNRSGKTTSACIEAVIVYTGIIPRALQGVYPHKIPTRPRHVRIIVADYSKAFSETLRPMLIGPDYGILPEAWSTWDEQEHMFTGPDGSYLSIMAIDPTEKTDPNVLRGPQIDHTMIDEINTEVAFTESIARAAALKSGPRTVTLSFCPQNGYQCWTYDRLYAACYDKLTKKRLPREKQHSDIFPQMWALCTLGMIDCEILWTYSIWYASHFLVNGANSSSDGSFAVVENQSVVPKSARSERGISLSTIANPRLSMILEKVPSNSGGKTPLNRRKCLTNFSKYGLTYSFEISMPSKYVRKALR